MAEEFRDVDNMEELFAWFVEMVRRLLVRRLVRRIVGEFIEKLKEGETGGCLDAGLMTGGV